jgi:ketosteroid isomerase-like protein
MADENTSSDPDYRRAVKLADAFLAAAAARDILKMAKLYSEDAIIWHNSDGLEMTVQAHLESFYKNTASLRNLRYVDKRLRIFDGGFVHQYRALGNIADQSLDMPICAVCEVTEGRISRLDEYYDTGALKAGGIEVSHT